MLCVWFAHASDFRAAGVPQSLCNQRVSHRRFRHSQITNSKSALIHHWPSSLAFARCWTVTCPHLWSPHCRLHPSCLSRSSPRLPSFQRPAAHATVSASVVCLMLPALKTSWSSWESTPLTSNPTASTWSLTSRSDWWGIRWNCKAQF